MLTTQKTPENVTECIEILAYNKIPQDAIKRVNIRFFHKIKNDDKSNITNSGR